MEDHPVLHHRAYMSMVQRLLLPVDNVYCEVMLIVGLI